MLFISVLTTHVGTDNKMCTLYAFDLKGIGKMTAKEAAVSAMVEKDFCDVSE